MLDHASSDAVALERFEGFDTERNLAARAHQDHLRLARFASART